MEVKFLKVKGNWRDVADSARTTIGLDEGDKLPSSEWRRRMLLAEHSPIRQIILKWKWIDLKSWASVHIVRHWLGIVHWVKSQRTDRTGIDRDKLPQDSLVNHEAEANAQAIINISRKRLCKLASPETKDAWKEFLLSFKDKEPELFRCCVPDCIYRGYCYEYKSCGFHKKEAFQKELENYREGINE